MKRNVKAAVDKVRLEAGLPVYDRPLVPAKCETCERIYFWRTVPEHCPWPGCAGELSEVKNETT